MTGLAIWRDGVIGTGQHPYQDAMDLMEAWLPDLQAIIVERYVVSGRTVRLSRQYAALEQIGICRRFARKAKIPFVLQAAADAKSFVTDGRLRKLELFKATPGGHANDAARHLVLYMVRNGDLSPETFVD